MWDVTLYSGWSKFYFRHLLKQVIEVGGLQRPGLTILDFGCGTGELKRMLPGARVIGYDVVPSLTDVPDWRPVDFDVLVANEVFYSFHEAELEGLLKELRGKNPKLELVVGISCQGWLNRLGMLLLNRPRALSAARMGPEREVEVLLRHCRILRRKGVFHLARVYSLGFLVPEPS